jgi:hypothetical protein
MCTIFTPRSIELAIMLQFWLSGFIGSGKAFFRQAGSEDYQ